MAVVVAFVLLQKGNKELKYVRQLREGTKSSKFSSEVLYQKLYIFYLRTPFIKRYLFKIRRRLEIINIDDEYLTRKQSAQILTKTLLIVIPLTIAIIILTNKNLLLMSILLIFEIFLLDTFIDGRVDKIDNNLLKQQIGFFSEIRHAYHEFNMVEEAIYQTAQDDENPEVSRQAEKIYEILISDDPESELEKYYDVAPNAYLKEFAGISYLTKEFGDRKVDGASLYLKNLNNITQEMQLEILKRDKLNYVFQSLSVISIVPMLCLEPIKNWAISQFGFVRDFYDGRNGMLVQILILVTTLICYLLTRKLKDNGSTTINTKNTENPWQEKLYQIKPIKKIVDLFMPKPGSKEARKIEKTMKDAASKDKMQWLYINRILLCIVSFIVSIFLFGQLHQVVINKVYTDPTTTYNIIGQLNEKDEKKAMELTESDNEYIRYFKNKGDLEQEDIERAMERGRVNDDYVDSKQDAIETAAERIMDKIAIVNSEYLSWLEVLGAMVIAMIAYMSPLLLLKFQTTTKIIFMISAINKLYIPKPK